MPPQRISAHERHAASPHARHVNIRQRFYDRCRLRDDVIVERATPRELSAPPQGLLHCRGHVRGDDAPLIASCSKCHTMLGASARPRRHVGQPSPVRLVDISCWFLSADGVWRGGRRDEGHQAAGVRGAASLRAVGRAIFDVRAHDAFPSRAQPRRFARYGFSDIAASFFFADRRAIVRANIASPRGGDADRPIASFSSRVILLAAGKALCRHGKATRVELSIFHASPYMPPRCQPMLFYLRRLYRAKSTRTRLFSARRDADIDGSLQGSRADYFASHRHHELIFNIAPKPSFAELDYATFRSLRAAATPCQLFDAVMAFPAALAAHISAR